MLLRIIRDFCIFAILKKRIFFINSIIAAASMIIVMQSCDDSKKGECGQVNISQSGGDDSHNNGQNCMSCHVSGGTGEGCFVVAGSVYNSAGSSPMGSGTIKLYTGPNGTGTVAAEIAVDSKGNFYTTESVNFGSTGLYPSYTTSTGQTKYMGSFTGNGQCNSCHGVVTGKITAP